MFIEIPGQRYYNKKNKQKVANGLARYDAEQCPVCTGTFHGEADIVVCPVCGTPHHRQCWVNHGGCANAQRHGAGFSWQPARHAAGAAHDPQASDPNAGLGEICPVCGRNNPKNTLFCPGCGTSLAGGAQRQQAPPFAGNPFFAPAYDGQQTIQGLSAAEVAQVVRLNTATYIPRFLRMEGKKAPVSFNWAAFLFSPFWFFYRKMYAVGAVLLSVLFALSLAFAPALSQAYDELAQYTQSAASQVEKGGTADPAAAQKVLASAHVQATMIFMGIELFMMIVAGFLANPLYRRYTVTKAKAARELPEPLEKEMYLRKKGGVSFWTVGVAYLAYRLVGLIASSLIFR